MELAAQLKTLRGAHGLSQADVAHAVYVSRQTVSNWENGKTYPDVESLLLLSELFGVSLDEMVKGDVIEMKRILEEDSRTMSQLAWVALFMCVVGFVLFATLAILWQEPSGVGRLTMGDLVGLAFMAVFWSLGLVAAVKVDKLKKKHDLVTYREVSDFMDGRAAGDGGVPGQTGRPGFAREHPALAVAAKVVVGGAVGAVLMLVVLLLSQAVS